MARILTSCDHCLGDVALTTHDVRIRFCGDDKTGCYVFACPTCTAHVAKPADARTLDLLVAAGCRLTPSGGGQPNSPNPTPARRSSGTTPSTSTTCSPTPAGTAGGNG